jgi:hypothetical protein
MKKKITFIAINILLLVIFDILFSNVYKFFVKDSFFNDTPNRVFSSVYNHTLVEDFRGTDTWWLGNREYKYDFFTNSLGLKDKSNRIVGFTSSKKRIAFIGDSFTEGIGLSYPQTFVGIIDSTLSKNNIEVLNFGVSSYAPVIYWRKIKHYLDAGLKIDNLVVFIDISDVVDEMYIYKLDEQNRVAFSYESIEKSTVRDWLNQNSSIYRFYVFTKKYFKKQFQKPKSNDIDLINDTKWRSLWTVNNWAYKEYGQKGQQQMAFYMNKLNEECKKNNIKLTIAVYPWPNQIYYNDLNSIHVKFWNDWALKSNIDFINFFPFFIKNKQTKAEQQSIINQNYIQNDFHFNKNGNRLIASEFLKIYKP